TRVFSRAFLEAYRHARAQQVYRTANPAAAQAGSSAISSSLTVDEACKILHVGKQTTKEEVMERYKRLFDANDPKKGGSFYLQSKIYRARERLEKELGSMSEAPAAGEAAGEAAAAKAEGTGSS